MNGTFDLKSGFALSRVLKSTSNVAKTYSIYGLSELREDLGMSQSQKESATISTEEDLPILEGGELVMSLMNPTAGFVKPDHAGYVLSQNFVQIIPGNDVDPNYLLFLLNESSVVRNQIQNGYQNVARIEKVPINTLRKLQLPTLPDLHTQQLIGQKYTLELKLKRLRDRRNELIHIKAIEEMRRIADA